MLLFFVLIPLAAAFLITLLGRRFKHSGDLLACLASLSLLALSLPVAGAAGLSKTLVFKIGGWGFPLGISLAADALSGFMLVTVNLVSFLALVYSVSYMRRYTGKWKFHTLFMLMSAGMNGVILSTDIFSLYVLLELASLSGYSLVAFGVEAQDLEASFKYAIMGSLASILILLGIALLYSYTSSLNMADIALNLAGRPRGLLINFVSVLFLAGFGLKAALVPFHAWLPDAHSSAPSPVSAVLSGTFIKTLGIYALVRIFFNCLGLTTNVQEVLVALGVISMVAGAFLAIAQNDIKRMFAYSSISQIGYIVFAFGIATPLALAGGLFHLFNHACFKSLLFLNAGSIEYSTGTRDLNKMGGLSAKLPVTAATSLLASMSISGVPPLGGFWSKLLIILAAVEAGHFVLASIAVLVSIVTLIYYLKFQTAAFFAKPKLSLGEVREAPFSMKLSMVALAVVCVVAGLMLAPLFRNYLDRAVDVLAYADNYKAQVLGAIIR